MNNYSGKYDQKQLLSMIYSYSFMVNELNLFLDTHPKCMEALSAYEHYSKLRLDAIRNYSMMYGPLLADQVDINQGWSWVKTPWPWEGEC